MRNRSYLTGVILRKELKIEDLEEKAEDNKKYSEIVEKFLDLKGLEKEFNEYYQGEISKWVGMKILIKNTN